MENDLGRERASAEELAYALMKTIADAKNRHFGREPVEGWQRADRKYLLDLYAECLEATKGRRPQSAEMPGRPSLITAPPPPRVEESWIGR